MEEPIRKRRPWVVVLLCTIPLWLLVSGGLGIWGYFRAQKAEQRKESARFATAVSASSMADDFQKLSVAIGARNGSVDEGRGLTRAASWIEGTLGPSNTGYTVQRILVPQTGAWPILRIDLRGSDEKAAPLWIAVAYDTPSTSEGILDSSSAVISAIAAAQALAGEKPVRPVRFVFLPSSGLDSIDAAFVKLATAEGAPHAVLCLGSMRVGESLEVSAEGNHQTVTVLGSLGQSSPLSQANDPMASRLSLAGLPVAVISSKPLPEAGSVTTEPERLAASTGRLVELIRRLMTRK